MDRPKPRWAPDRIWPWLTKPWMTVALAVAVFALLGTILMLTPERKDSSYWAGYAQGQRWVHEGGYQAHEESITAYCRDRAAAQQNTAKYEHGCVDGAHNAMK